MAENKPPEVDETKPEFANPDDFANYDEVDSTDGEAELPEDSFDESAAKFDEEVND